MKTSNLNIGRKINEFLILTFPSIIMITITLISFTHPTDYLNLKSLFIISLLLLFPIIFLIQAILSVTYKTNYLWSLSISSLTFITIIFLYMNFTALPYLLFYIILGLFVYYLKRKNR
jgi:hypothetical protein